MALMIRKLNSRHLTVEDLIGARNMERKIADQLKRAVENQHRILIGGRIGTGGTPSFNALRKYLPSDGRDLLIEFTSEIHMGQDNQVCFELWQPQDGLPGVAIRDLLKAALRHRPDRIVLGEIRGGGSIPSILNAGPDEDTSMRFLRPTASTQTRISSTIASFT